MPHPLEPVNKRVFHLTLQELSVRCCYCGSSNVTKKGSRKNKKTSPQRYLCHSCKRKFTARSLFDTQVAKDVDIGLDMAVAEPSLAGIASRLRIDLEVDLTRFKLAGNIASVSHLLNVFEEDDRVRPICGELQVDEMFQRSTNGSHFWILNVLETTTRRWLVSLVAEERDEETWLKALRLATRRCQGFQGKTAKCDGWGPASKAIVAVGMVAFARSKAVDYGHINLIERLHGSARGLSFPHRKSLSFSSATQDRVDLLRHHYNLRAHDGLQSRSPFMVSTGLRCRKFSELIRIAERVVWSRAARHSGNKEERRRARESLDLYF